MVVVLAPTPVGSHGPGVEGVSGGGSGVGVGELDGRNRGSCNVLNDVFEDLGGLIVVVGLGCADVAALDGLGEDENEDDEEVDRDHRSPDVQVHVGFAHWGIDSRFENVFDYS